MAKKIGKANITVITIAAAILAIVGIFAVAVTYASTDNWLRVDLPYAGGASTDTLAASLDAGDSKVVNVTHEPKRGEYHFSAYDLVVCPAAALSTGGGFVVEQYADCTVVRNVPVAVASLTFTAAVNEAYAFPSAEEKTENGTVVDSVSYGNVFVADFFGLQAVNQEKNTNPSDAIASGGAFKNVFVTGGFTVDKPLTFTPPCFLHLLNATVKLKADLQIKHTYGGIYGIDAVDGKIVQDGGKLSVTAPNAYFGIAEGVVTNADGTPAAVVVTCSADVLTSAQAGELADSLLNAAAGYIERTIPARLTHNVILPAAYGVSGIRFAYEITGGGEFMTADGVIHRTESSQNVTVKVTASYQGIYAGLIAPSPREMTTERVVVGTGANAAADELALTVSGTLEKSLAAIGDKYAPHGDVELGKAIAVFRTLGFGQSDVTLTVGEPGGSLLTVNGAARSSYVASGGNDADSVRIVFAKRIVNGAKLSVKATCGGAATEKTYTLTGMTATETTEDYLAKMTEYLETFVYTPEFASTDSEYGFISLATDRADPNRSDLYRGAQLVAVSPGVTDAEVKAVAMTDDLLAELKADPQAFAAANWESWSTDNRKFTVKDLVTGNGSPTGGTIQAKMLASGEKYVVLQQFTIDTDLSVTTDEPAVYYTYRVALVPETGVGGNETTKYIAGNTFADFYETLDNGRLLESKYTFAIDSAGIGIYAVIESENAIGDYCYFAYNDAAGKIVRVDVNDLAGYAAKEYFIYVDIAKFPERNASAKAKIYFYYAQQSEEFKKYAKGGFIDDPGNANYDAIAAASCFTTQSYGFTLPGIYRVGSAFASDAFYNHILNARSESGYIYDAYRKNPDEDGAYRYAGKNYLYADGAAAVCDLLDCTSPAGAEIDIEGIELLTGTAGFVFDGVTVTGFDRAFAEINTHIKTLSMRSCGLTADSLGVSLANCRGLTAVDLSDNGELKLSSLGNLVYRTVSTLKISRCGLTAIAGVSGLPNLTEIDVSHNAIKYFGELTALTKLKRVNVAGNTLSDAENITLGNGGVAYGTAGEVNVPVYVFLLNVRETEITGDNGILGVGGGITSAQQILSLVLTGVEYDRTVSDTTFRKEVWSTGYVVESVMTVDADFNAKTAFADGENFYFIVSVTGDGTTSYALYDAAYRTGGAA